MRAKAENIRNFSVMCNHVTIVPPLKALLESPDLRLDAFIGPGHVSTVIGCRPYEFIPAEYGQPVAVAGFEPLDLLQSIYMIMRQLDEGRSEVENQYGRVVLWDGNARALEIMSRGFRPAPLFRMEGPRASSHRALWAFRRICRLGCRAALRRSRCAGRRSEGVPVRRGPQGRYQAVGMQGLRHRLHS